MRGFSRVEVIVSADSIDGKGPDSVLVKNGCLSMEMSGLDIVLDLMPKGSNVLVTATGQMRSETVHRLSHFIAASHTLVAVDLSQVTGFFPVTGSPFRANPNLYGIRFPHNLPELTPEAFAFCPTLVSVELPASVKSVGSGAFKGCSSLTRLSFADFEGWKYVKEGKVVESVEDLSRPLVNPSYFTEADSPYVDLEIFK